MVVISEKQISEKVQTLTKVETLIQANITRTHLPVNIVGRILRSTRKHKKRAN